MVTAKTILIVLAIGAFFFAGGSNLVRPAFAQAKTDIGDLATGVSETVQNIRNKTEAGMNGEAVG